MLRPKMINLSLLNGHLICGLCGGYLIDATVLKNCIHAFCRSCILKYLSELNKVCPLCQTLIQEGRPPDGLEALRPDVTLQRVVYKLVPGLLRVEIDRIAEFHKRYAKNPSKVTREVRLSCKEAQALEDSTSADHLGSGLSSPTPTPLATRSLSRSVSYPYQFSGHHSVKSFPPATSISCLIDTTESVSLSLDPLNPVHTPPSLSSPSEAFFTTVYLLCPASCTVAHLQRLLLAKHDDSAFPGRWTVDIFLDCEYLEPAHSLRELAFLYAWPTQRRMLPLMYRFSDSRAVWWGSPMPRLDPPPLPTTPQPVKKRKRFST
ncbi:unnamed protein product [Mesocestoides corti]|uniref:RING-type domain-containing protein n=1 Tax=Mesocestoides corti TaxID=53468 RepID=A0A0R3UBG3_MESCO|nr:unnamed protein product [Mesocestoides corti]